MPRHLTEQKLLSHITTVPKTFANLATEMGIAPNQWQERAALSIAINTLRDQGRIESRWVNGAYSFLRKEPEHARQNSSSQTISQSRPQSLRR